MQPDTVVPNPGNPQSLNRYSFVLNNPIRFTDPSGHAPQYPGDPDASNAACSTQWSWQNRWYMAHGKEWSGSGWGNDVNPIFYDQPILEETVGEAGITFVGDWAFDSSMQAIGIGIVQFGKRLNGGLGQLRSLLGGWAQIAHGSCVGYSCALPPGTHTVKISDSLLQSYSAWISQTTVHELAHIIDWHSQIEIGRIEMGVFGQIGYLNTPEYGTFSSAWDETPLSKYAAGARFRPCPREWERWAEAVRIWVFDSQALAVNKNVPDIAIQLKRIGALLNGEY